jgi:hypothetical protein
MLLSNTSQYNTKLVRFIIKHAAALIDISDVAINIKNSEHHYAGRMFARIPFESPWNSHPKATHLIVCRVGGPELFPYQCKGYPGRKVENGRWPTPLLADWMECMVMLVAHELFHVVQCRSKARYSEQETEAFAMKRLEAWRELVAAGKVPELPHRQPKALKSSVSRETAIQGKLAHCQAMLRKNETKLKKFGTIVKKWRTKAKYYQRQLAEPDSKVKAILRVVAKEI